MVDLLGHHPSVCSGARTTRRSPSTANRASRATTIGAARSSPRRGAADVGQAGARPLGHARARAAHDGTRPVVRHSRRAPRPRRARHRHATSTTAGTTASSTASPRRFGAGRGSAASCRSSARRPCPSTRRSWSRALARPRLGRTRAASRAPDRRVRTRAMPPGDAKSFDEWRATTQAYQAALLQLQIEDLRRLKYAPTGGFAQFSLRGSAPGGQLVGARPRARAEARLRRAARRLPAVLPMVEPRAGLVHVVNDTRADAGGADARGRVDGRVDALDRRRRPPTASRFVGRVDLVRRRRCRGRSSSTRTPAAVANRYPLLDVAPVTRHTAPMLDSTQPVRRARFVTRHERRHRGGSGPRATRSAWRSVEEASTRPRAIERTDDSDAPAPPRGVAADPEGPAGRARHRPVLPIGGRQEVGHGAHRHRRSWASSSST